jgi:hypothetical protein
MKVKKNRDVVIAGKHYDSVYAVHAGWLFSYRLVRNAGHLALWNGAKAGG